jgi:hypothetical protein
MFLENLKFPTVTNFHIYETLKIVNFFYFWKYENALEVQFLKFLHFSHFSSLIFLFWNIFRWLEPLIFPEFL